MQRKADLGTLGKISREEESDVSLYIFHSYYFLLYPTWKRWRGTAFWYFWTKMYRQQNFAYSHRWVSTLLNLLQSFTSNFLHITITTISKGSRLLNVFFFNVTAPPIWMTYFMYIFLWTKILVKINEKCSIQKYWKDFFYWSWNNAF